MHLIEIDLDEVQNAFPAFYDEHTHFFIITYQDKDIGIYGIKTIDSHTCEIRLCVFEEYRYQIPYRQGLKLLLDYPFSLGYSKILISSKKKSVITLLQQCRRLGVMFKGYCEDKIWFEIQRQTV